MATNPLLIFESDNLNESYNFEKSTIAEKTRIVEMIFSRQRNVIEEYFVSCLFKTLILAEFDRVYRDHKQDIIFRLNGIMTFKQVKNLFVRYF